MGRPVYPSHGNILLERMPVQKHRPRAKSKLGQNSLISITIPSRCLRIILGLLWLTGGKPIKKVFTILLIVKYQDNKHNCLDNIDQVKYKAMQQGQVKKVKGENPERSLNKSAGHTLSLDRDSNQSARVNKKQMEPAST